MKLLPMGSAIIDWKTELLPREQVVNQVYAFILDKYGRVFLQDDNGRFNLPGGKPEKNESFEQTLDREILEESSIRVKNYSYLGYLNIYEDPQVFDKRIIQVRYFCFLDKIYENRPDPSTGRKYGRLFCPIDKVQDLLKWGNHLNFQIIELKKRNEGLPILARFKSRKIEYIDSV